MRWTRKQDESGRQAARSELRAIPAFARCSDAELARIDDLATEIRRPAGTVLQTQGRGTRQVAVLVSGSAVDRTVGDRDLVPWSLVGSEVLRGQELSLSTIVTTSEARLLVFGLAELDELLALDGIRAWADGARVPSAAAHRQPVRASRPASAAGLAPAAA
jgi:hypothetical protein